jgi:hypothetical protein
MIRKIDAILSLMPDADVTVIENESVVWNNEDQTPLTEQQISAEIARLQTQHDATEYQRQRAAEYPPLTDYLDGVVKGDQAQIDAYIAACQAVKAKYPKAS